MGQSSRYDQLEHEFNIYSRFSLPELVQTLVRELRDFVGHCEPAREFDESVRRSNVLDTTESQHHSIDLRFSVGLG